MYAMKMGFEDSLDIIITDKAHELLLEHGGVVGLVAELTIQALNALLNSSEEAKISIYTYGAATIFILLVNDFDDKIKGFDMEDAVFSGVESRTSSPVRIVRNELLESDISGVFPCGEGAGYAGGITSAAVDGIKVAEKIAQKISAGI